MNQNPPTDEQLNDDRAIQVLSDQGAQCGDCGDQPGDRVCPDCERCRGWYVAALRKAGWAPQPEHEALLAEVHRLRAETTELRGENAKLIRWHREDETALDKMRGTIVRLRVELAEATAAAPVVAAVSSAAEDGGQP